MLLRICCLLLVITRVRCVFPSVSLLPDYVNVFRVQHDDGGMKIKSLVEAMEMCARYGAVIAESWRLRDSVTHKHYWPCQPCGWLALGRNYRTRCWDEANGRYETEGYVPCADDPVDEGYEGYDVYCYGGVKEIPPDAVAINDGPSNRGYVFIVHDGDDEVIETESAAKSDCLRRGATLANILQVQAAWRNGFSQCHCAWMYHYTAAVMNEPLLACGNTTAILGCHYGDIKHVLCFMPASENPQGVNTVDFASLQDGVFPMGVELGATQIDEGYVFPSMSSFGYMRTPTIQMAWDTCREQSAAVATPDQAKKAYINGFSWCECGFVWQDAEIEMDVLVRGPGRVQYTTNRANEQCGSQRGIIVCSLDDPTSSGYNVYCFKDKKLQPPARAWRIPARSVRVTGGRVYHIEHRDGKYLLTNNWYANKECGRKYTGGVSASMSQLEEAAENGLTRCRCGYVSDVKNGTTYMPMYRPILSCGNNVGVIPCPGDYDDVPETGPGWDAWCFISDHELNKIY